MNKLKTKDKLWRNPLGSYMEWVILPSRIIIMLVIGAVELYLVGGTIIVIVPRDATDTNTYGDKN